MRTFRLFARLASDAGSLLIFLLAMGIWERFSGMTSPFAEEMVALTKNRMALIELVRARTERERASAKQTGASRKQTSASPEPSI